jgi:hypothetical protein
MQLECAGGDAGEIFTLWTCCKVGVAVQAKLPYPKCWNPVQTGLLRRTLKETIERGGFEFLMRL